MQKDLSLSETMSYLSIIERHINRRPNFDDYIPSKDFDPNDIVSIQREASSMMKFVGLHDYCALVTYEKQKVGTAGSINLNHEKEVYIDLNKNLLSKRKSREIILRVLAHEICHKLLYTNGLELSDTLENEICTDLAAIYVGFGQITIHGCASIEKNIDKKHDSSDTFTYSVGYLTPKTYILAYVMMCRSYKLLNRNFAKAVDNNVLLQAVVSAKSEAVRFKFYTKDQLKKQFFKKSCDLARIKKDIVFLETMLDDLEQKMVTAYTQLDSLYNSIVAGNAESYPITAMYAMKYEHTDNSYATLRRSLDQLIDVLAVTMGTSEKVLNEKSRQVACPICGKKSSTPLRENEVSIRKCKCGRIFVWDAEPFISLADKMLRKINKFFGKR